MVTNGMKKCTTLHMDRAYWKGMDADIPKYVKHCKICTTHKATQAFQPMLPWDIPEGPLERLGNKFLLPQQCRVPPNSRHFKQVSNFVQNVIQSSRTNCTEDQITDFSVWTPKRLTTYNGPPFSSETFARFLQDQHIGHITSSPHYPKSNRLSNVRL